jgi:hypothetical protein
MNINKSTATVLEYQIIFRLELLLFAMPGESEKDCF